MGSEMFDFRRERKRRRLENPPESDNDSVSSGDDAGSSDGAYDELYDTDNGDDDEDNVTEPLEEEEMKALHHKRKLEEVYGAEKRVKKSRDNIKAPTTAEEVKRLRETEKLFHSNLYRLQIEEMLKEVKLKAKYVRKFDEWYPSLEATILAMEESEDHELSDLDWIQEMGVALPLHQDREFKGRFTFIPPTSVNIIGSHAYGCSIGPKLNVDIAVNMPDVSRKQNVIVQTSHNCPPETPKDRTASTEMFFKKDYRNERFQRKRCLFLCCIASQLLSSDLIEKSGENGPKFVAGYSGDPLLPVLEISPAGNFSQKAKVRIHAFASLSIFKLSLLAPSKCTMDTTEDLDAENESTPFHNASTLAALVAQSNQDLTKSSLTSQQNVLDALILCKIWLRQRALDEGYAGFGSHVLTMLVVYLLQKRRISPQMSSYQIVRIIWNFLGESDWTNPEGAPSIGDGKPAEFLQEHQVVFLDVTGVYNFTYSLTSTTYSRVKSESRMALQFLDDTSIDSFQALFIQEKPFSRQFDHVIRFKNSKCLERLIEEKASVGQKLDEIANKERLVVSLILKALERGLASRVKEWGVKPSPTPTWPISTSPPKSISPSFLIGINLDTQHACSILDKGPGANEPEAAEFREFWGEKSELRRFQDGSISEAVVWLDGKASLAQRRVVCRLIVEYILKHRLGLPTESIVYLADQIEESIHLTKVRHPDFTYGTGEEATLAALSAFGKLSKNIRSLTDLPLEVTEILGVSPTFRYTEVFPPLAISIPPPKTTYAIENCMGLREKTGRSNLPPFMPPLEVVVSLGLSGKWPSKAQAVRRIRAAFNVKIANSLHQSFKLTCQAYPEFVDVIQDGFVFRLRVAYQNEISLLKEVHLPNGSLKHQDTSDSLELERQIVHLPSISAYLHGLHQQAPAFGPTACLAKRWISSQMTIGEHIPEIAIELLVAYTFLRPEPFSTPTQPQTAFLRFLHFVGKTNWNTQPIILNFKDDIAQGEITEIEKYFIGQRKSLPPLFIVTPTDHKKSVWTSSAPSLTILIRLAELAQAAISVLEKQYLVKKPNPEAWKQIFTPDLNVYDVLIHLSPGLPRSRFAIHLNGHRGGETRLLKPYRQEANELIPVLGFDPVQIYLHDLKASFGDFALFFHDTYGGTVIGVVWKPPALEPKTFSGVFHVVINSDGYPFFLGTEKGRKFAVKALRWMGKLSYEGIFLLVSLLGLGASYVNQINGRHVVDGRLELNRKAIIEDFEIMGKGIVSRVDTPERSAMVVPE